MKAAFLVASALCVVLAAPATPPNVLFIMVDDLTNTLSTYGNPDVITPNFERLAARSTQYQNAYVSVAVCAPSRSAMLTSLRCDTSQVYTIGPYFRHTSYGLGMRVQTLPQLFRLKGYTAVGHGKIWHQGTYTGGLSSSEGGGDQCPGLSATNDCPWTAGPSTNTSVVTSVASWSEPYHFCDQWLNDTVQNPKMQQWPCAKDTWPSCGSGCVQPEECVECFQKCGTWNVTTYKWAACDCDPICYPEGLIANASAADIHRLSNSGKPFFLAVGMKRPHLNYKAPKSFFDMYNLSGEALPVHPNPPPSMPPIAYKHNCGFEGCEQYVRSDGLHYETETNDTETRALRLAYKAVITYMDSQLGVVLDALDASPAANNTIITLVGDHGYNLGERGEWLKSNTNENSVHIPMFVSVPLTVDPTKASHGKVSTSVVESIDLFPTLTDMAGVGNPTQRMGGESLLPLLVPTTGRTRNKTWALSQWARRPSCATQHHCGDGHGDPFQPDPDQSAMGYTLRTDEYRYTAWVGMDWAFSAPDWNNIIAQELYSHVGDKGTQADREVYEWDNLAYDANMTEVVEDLQAQLEDIVATGTVPPLDWPHPLYNLEHNGSCLASARDGKNQPTSSALTTAPCEEGQPKQTFMAVPAGGLDAPIAQLASTSPGGLCVTVDTCTAGSTPTLSLCSFPAVVNTTTAVELDPATGVLSVAGAGAGCEGLCVAPASGGGVELAQCSGAPTWTAAPLA